jgi:hypothetical protein
MPRKRGDVYCITPPAAIEKGVSSSNGWYTLTILMLCASIVCLMTGRAAWAVTMSTVTMLTLVSTIASAPPTHKLTSDVSPTLNTSTALPASIEKPFEASELPGYYPDKYGGGPALKSDLKTRRGDAKPGGAASQPADQPQKRARFENKEAAEEEVEEEVEEEEVVDDFTHFGGVEEDDPDARAALENAQAIRVIRERGVYGVKSNYNDDIFSRAAGVPDSGFLVQPVGQREGFASFLLHDMPSKKDQFMRPRLSGAGAGAAAGVPKTGSQLLNAPAFVGGRFE